MRHTKPLTSLFITQLFSQIIVAVCICALIVNFWHHDHRTLYTLDNFSREQDDSNLSRIRDVSDAWISTALAAQNEYQEVIPIRLMQPPSTHNSFLSVAEGYGLCSTLSFALQNWTLSDQIMHSIRQVELDVFRIDSELTVCHPCYDECTWASWACNRSLNTYATPTVPLSSPYFGCDPEINLSFKTALEKIWRSCRTYVDEHPQRRARELLILHLQLHVDSSITELEETLDSNPWISQLVTEIRESIPEKALLSAAFDEPLEVLIEKSVAAFRERTPVVEYPALWVLPVIDLLNPSNGKRTPANSPLFSRSASPLRKVGVPNVNPLEYPENRLNHLLQDGTCLVHAGGRAASRISKNFTYFVGSIFSSPAHITEAYRCGFAVRAAMPSSSLRKEALCGMIWSWKANSSIAALTSETPKGFHQPVFMDATDCRWTTQSPDLEHAADIWLCTTDPSRAIGERTSWNLVADLNSSCLVDIPRTGYENAFACAVLRERKLGGARLGVAKTVGNVA